VAGTVLRRLFKMSTVLSLFDRGSLSKQRKQSPQSRCWIMKHACMGAWRVWTTTKGASRWISLPFCLSSASCINLMAL